jgi:hypothetical protein
MQNSMNNEAFFQSVLERHGGLWKLENIDSSGRSIAARLLDLFKALSPGVQISYIDNKAFNSFATTESGRDIVGMYIGSLEILHNCFLNLLSSRNCLTSIGNASAERGDAKAMNLLEPFTSGPVDPIRSRAAKDLAFCASIILFYHELSHVELCHIPFLRQQLRIDEYVELNAAPLSQKQCLLLRTLENDADITGAVSSTLVWKFFYENMKLSYLDPIGWERTWITAAHMLYWVMELMNPHHTNRKKSTHPSPYFRMISVMDAVSIYGGIPMELTPEQREHDSLLPWLAPQFIARNEPLILPDSSAIEAERVSLTREYVKIADRLEELQDKRGQKSGRPIVRPDYPGRGWTRNWRRKKL